MDSSPLFAWIESSGFSTSIRDSSYLFPWIESVHVLALTLVVGSIAVVDLRLLGLASVNRTVSSLTSEVLPLTWIAFAFAVMTGGSLFASHAVGYAENFQFRMKLILLALAGLNMLVFHWIMSRSPLDWREFGRSPWPGKLAGAISLILWIGIVAFGRWIGFANVR
jgi:hypothetical protein